MLRYQIRIGRISASEPQLPGHRGKFHRVKSAIAAFLALSAAIGVLLAAFVLGSALAVVILILVIVAVSAWLFLRLWHRAAGKGKIES